MNKEEIKILINKNKSILDKYKVKSVALFGSYVRNEQTQDSDIDLLIELENPTFRNYIGLLSELEKLLGNNVDLVCKDALKPCIKALILSEAEEIK